jgi:hypothetical protein
LSLLSEEEEEEEEELPIVVMRMMDVICMLQSALMVIVALSMPWASVTSASTVQTPSKDPTILTRVARCIALVVLTTTEVNQLCGLEALTAHRRPAGNLHRRPRRLPFAPASNPLEISVGIPILPLYDELNCISDCKIPSGT